MCFDRAKPEQQELKVLLVTLPALFVGKIMKDVEYVTCLAGSEEMIGTMVMVMLLLAPWM